MRFVAIIALTSTAMAQPRTEGPLSSRAKVPETPWADREKQMDLARKTNLDKAALHEDREVYLKLATELQLVSNYMRDQTGLVERLAPYSIDSVANSFIFLSEHVPLCARPPGQMWHCEPYLVAPVHSIEPPFSIEEAAPGVLVLTVRDFDVAWPKLELDRLKGKIVVDLRTASGSDPRPLLPWLERVTGRAPFKPLREILRPKDLDPYVAAYSARFLTETRDPAVWASLAGTMPQATKSSTAPISVIVGDTCGAACELVARSLVTYAHAKLYGSAGYSPRLARDEPALLVLPRSKIEIYFHATAYTLNEDIERATGATADWHPRDTRDRDLLPFVIKELSMPAARCDAMPAFATTTAMPLALHQKIPNVSLLGSCHSPGSEEIRITTQAPLSAIQRYAQSCHVQVGTNFELDTHSLATLTQIAQSALVERIEIDCVHPPKPD